MEKINLDCPIHLKQLVLRRNERGGIFYGCPCFDGHDCRVSFSPTTRRWFGIPGVSKNGISYRERCEATLKAQGIDPVEWFSAVSLQDTIAFLNVK